MAITKTIKVASANIAFNTKSDARADAFIQVKLRETWDDPNDDSLPLSTTKTTNITNSTDVSGYPQFVQDLAAWLWSS